MKLTLGVSLPTRSLAPDMGCFLDDSWGGKYSRVFPVSEHAKSVASCGRMTGGSESQAGEVRYSRGFQRGRSVMKLLR